MSRAMSRAAGHGGLHPATGHGRDGEVENLELGLPPVDEVEHAVAVCGVVVLSLRAAAA